MASINASTSGAGGVITTADNTGTLQLQSGGTTIATISSTGITTQVGAPAFSAYANSAQTISSATYTKITINTEEFDTNNNFDSTTNYRFTPTVAGYYQVNAALAFGSTYNGVQCYIWKNGSRFKNGNNGNGQWVTVSALIYMNGSTDYLEFYGAQLSGSGQGITTGLQETYFQAFLARSA